jgi:hypothetical protein
MIQRVNVNDGFAAFSGLKREECIGKTTLGEPPRYPNGLEEGEK